MRFVLMILLAIVSSGAAAQLILAGQSIEHDYYFDSATIQKSGNLVKMWEVYDYKAAQEVGDAFTYRSDRTLREYDCSNEQTRRLSVKVYSENMGNGALLVGYDDPSQWTHNQPASGVEHLWKIVCGKT